MRRPRAAAGGLEAPQHGSVDEGVARPGGVRACRRSADNGGGIARAVVIPALPDRDGLLAPGDLGSLPEGRLVLADATRDEVAVAVGARGRDEAESGGDVGGRVRRDAGGIARGPDEHVVSVEHQPPRRLQRAPGGDERLLCGSAVGQRKLRLAGAYVAQCASAVAAQVAHRDAVAARHGNEHRAHESGFGQCGRAFDGHAACGGTGACGRGDHCRDEQAGEQASHARTLRPPASPVKPEPSSLAAWARVCATICRTRCARWRNGSRWRTAPGWPPVSGCRRAPDACRPSSNTSRTG